MIIQETQNGKRLFTEQEIHEVLTPEQISKLEEKGEVVKTGEATYYSLRVMNE